MPIDPAAPHPASPAVPASRLAPGDRMLVLAPHPDDESLATGGLLQHARSLGVTTRVLFATDGEDNAWAQLVDEGRWPFRARDRARWGERRAAEAVAALQALGHPAAVAARLGLPDRGLTDGLLRADEAPARLLRDALRAWAPTMLVSPSPLDRHPDHAALAVHLMAALRALPAEARPERLLHFVVHGAEVRIAGALRLPLSAAERERKRAAVRCHRTQLRWRPHMLLSAVGEEETFEEVGLSCGLDPLHPVEAAWREDETLQVRLARTPRRGLGRPLLHVATLDVAGGLGVVTLDPVSGRPRAASARAAPLRSVAARHGDGLRSLALAFEELPAATRCLVKLEWPLERRIGLLGQFGWVEVATSEVGTGPRPAAENLGLADASAGLGSLRAAR